MSPESDYHSSRSSYQPSDTPPDVTEGESRGSFRREPPVVPERVEVLKANYKQAWLYFLLGVCLLVAWGIPIRYALIRALSFREADTGQRTSMEFVSIAYEGLSDMPGEVTAERFKEQIGLLKESGYNAITLKDVKALYEEGTPLPENSILLTFDHSRKSSYFDARRVLQRAGWRAVMFVWTKPIEDEDPSALRWPYIRAMIGTGAWEAGAQSHMGFERIVSDSEGRLKNFMTSPRWLARQSRYETPDEYRERLKEDHQLVYDRILRETKVPPAAFAFPYGDFGQFDERALLTRRLNLNLVSEFYDLAFIHGNAALNTRYSDRYRLNRLLVDSDWSAQDLLERLEAAWPKSEGLESEDVLGSPLAWQADWGGFGLGEGRADFYALEDNTGSKVWLNGTDLYQDFRGRFHLKIDKGQVGFFLRASKDGESHLYLALGEKGEVWLRQKVEGLEAFTLGTARYTREEDGTVELEVFLRGNQFFASTGGQPIFDEMITTRGVSEPGMLGLSVWDPDVGEARFELLDFELLPFNSRLFTFDPISSQYPYLAGWMSQNAYRFTHFSPPWLHLGNQGRGESLGWDPTFYSELANVYNLIFTPAIRVERLEHVDPVFIENLVERAVAAGADGLYCDLGGLRGAPNLTRITGWIQNMGSALEEKGLDLIVTLPEPLVRPNTVSSLFQGIPNLQITIVDSDNLRDALPTTDLPRLVDFIPVTIGQRDYPLFTQLTPGDTPRVAWATEVRSQILWERGFEAFGEGEFDLAIELWTRWSEVEPYSEKPPRFIGDAHLTQKNYATAIEFYQKSLELNPGQVSLVVNTARLLEQFAGRQSESAQMLNLYQRLFPDNTEIALAQAGLLLRQNRPVEAGKRIQEVVQRSPGDISALAMLHRLLQSPAERVENMEKILEVGKKLGMFTHFANAVKGYNLLVWPEAWRLMGLIQERADMDLPDAKIYHSLLPRETVVREKFQLGHVSDNWDNSSYFADDEMEGNLFLSASPTTTEAALILKRSDTLRNGFIEAELEMARGYFWLYARRSEGNMIRFGFEPDGRLYMQIWQNEEIVTNITREWNQPTSGVRLGLEIRGDAVFGYVDGRPAFGAPIDIPKNMNLGSWGLAPWAPQFGVAEAVVREVAGGPKPVHIAIFNAVADTAVDETLSAKIRANTHELSIVSPPWFFQNVSGDVRSELPEPLTTLQLLCRYYKIRLYPMIRSASARTLDVQQLVTLAKEVGVSGFTLSFARMPEEEWFEEVETQLAGTNLGLLAMQIDPRGGIAEVRELGGLSGFIAGPRETHSFPLMDLTERTEPVIAQLDLSSSPVAVIQESVPEKEIPETVAEPENPETGFEAEDTPPLEAESPVGKAPSLKSDPTPSRVFLF
ncbi:MAG: polysaccharide deacetylase family protein [Kiritimatiellia bacterium]